MANTITLSTDMNTVYIIDSNDDVIFSQSLSSFGAIININSDGDLNGQAATADLTGTTITKSVTGWQWTLTFHASPKKLSFIGDEEAGTQVDGEAFSIDRTNGIQIKRSGTNLVLITGTV